jgi:hypothetical protein
MASLEAGRLLADRYVLQDRLGDGGHAEVWAARDILRERLVALKFLHLRSGGSTEALPVLRHEAAMAHRLDHPGVLKVEDPVSDGEFVFLPMEFASGGDASWLRGAPWQRVLPVLLQVARVLEYAHSQGVVHRDIKPGNVLFDTLGNVRLSDFATSCATGSSDSLAAGSPFSASPEQLRDEPGATADDVYGLGALAYELLTRYPPFYPNFDAQRVLVEEPPAPVPVHPAPLALLDLIQSMLVRDAAARPGLAEIIESFERQLATAEPLPPEIGNDVVVEALSPAAVATLPVKKRRRGIGAAWWLVAAALAGVAALLWLPKPGPEIATAVPAITPREVERVADAVVPAITAAMPVEAPPAAPTGTPATLEDELRAGRRALDALQPALARAAFQRALALQADQPEALKGLAAAARLDTLLAGLAEAARMEARGELAGAADRYRLLLANAPQFTPARSGLDRVTQRLHEQRFEDLLATGADALRRGRIPVAQSAYRQAADIHPQDARVRDGQQRVAEVLENQRNAADLATGASLEEAERWDEALAHYRQVIARDATLRFAQDGVARCERRAALDRELRDYIARPERLSAPAVRKAAQQALARGESSASGAPRLQEQVQQLGSLLQALQVQVQVAIVSDESTRVSLAPLGDLGAFRWRELRLPPGHYTVIGRRDGFRDVRYEFEIGPGRVTPTLSVQCTERI